MKTMKVGIILPSYYPVPAVNGGAIETLIENFINENEYYKKFDITIYSYFNKEAFNKSKTYKNTKFKFIKINKIFERIMYLYLAIFTKLTKKSINNIYIKKVIKDIDKKGLEHVIVEGNRSFVVPLKEAFPNLNIYLHIHHDSFSEYKMYNEIIAQSCKKIITVSDYISKKTKLNLDKIHHDKVVTLMNGIDLNKFNTIDYEGYREQFRKKYNIREDEVVILFSGRILEIKGVRELILAFKKYCLNTNAKLLIVGNAGFRETINSSYDKELFEISEEIKDKIIFTGFIHNDDLCKIHAISDIAVVPSIWDEPSGLVVIEAMASGLPLIATMSGGIPELINDECAILIERDKDIIDNIGKSLLRLICDNRLQNKMGQNALNKSKDFSSKKYYDSFTNILLKDREKIKYED